MVIGDVKDTPMALFVGDVEETFGATLSIV